MQQPGYAPQGMQGYGPPPVMQQQPVAGPPPGCPPGLEYLTQVDQLAIKQQVEVLEIVTGFETANKYLVFNSMGQQVYKAKEQSDCCTRNICGPIRPFDMDITDNSGNPVIHLERPLACTSCFFPCCLQSLEVSLTTVLGL